jgi:hypothetical protein
MSSATIPSIWDGVDRLIDRAPALRDLQAHGLHLLAARRWRSLGRPVPTDLAVAELWAAFRTDGARRLLERIRAVCTGPIVLIKGPAAATVYPGANLRPFLDLDLLVEDPAAAQDALLRSGFEPTASMLHPETVHHLHPLQLNDIPLSVELHRYPKWIDGLDIPTFDELLEGAEDAAVLGLEGILTLRPPQHALVLTAHLWSHDPLARLLRVLDVAAVSHAARPADLDRLADAWGMQQPWRLTIEVADALFHGAKKPLPLRTWARNLNGAREASVLEMHVARCLAPFSIHSPDRAFRAAGGALAGLLRRQPQESWGGKLARTVRQVGDPSMRQSQHARAVAEGALPAERAVADSPEAVPAGTTASRAGAGGRRRPVVWLAASSVWAAAAALTVVLDVQVAYRAPVVLSFLLICPGLSIVRAFGIRRGAVEVALGVALSMALAVLVPAALLYAGAWSPSAALAVLIALTIAVAAIDVVRGRQRLRHARERWATL